MSPTERLSLIISELESSTIVPFMYHSMTITPVWATYSLSLRSYSTLSKSSTFASVGRIVTWAKLISVSKIVTASVSTTAPNSKPSEGTILAVQESVGLVAVNGSVHKSS